MISHFFIIVFSIFVYEYLKFTRFIEILNSNILFYKKFIKLLKLKKVSDYWKEKVILNYSKVLLFSSLKILFTIILIPLFVILIEKFINNFIQSILSVLGIIEVSIIFFVYHNLRKKFYAKL